MEFSAHDISKQPDNSRLRIGAWIRVDEIPCQIDEIEKNNLVYKKFRASTGQFDEQSF